MDPHVDLDEGQIAYRLNVLKVPPPLQRELAILFCKWKKCSGLEWTISRLKSLKVDLIRHKSGLPPLTWIRKNRKGTIYGPLGSLFRWSGKSDKNFRIAIQCMMVYTLWVYTKVTDKQYQKFFTAVTADPTVIPDSIRSNLRSTVSNFPFHRARLSQVSSILTYRGSPSRKSPMLVTKSVPQNECLLDEISNMIHPGNLSLYHRYRIIFDDLLYGFPSIRNWFSKTNKSMYPPHTGKVAFIQEPGGKLRSVASPFRIFQKVLEPLSDYAYSIVQRLPWDCTFDQSKAFQPVIQQLKQNKQVHSVDLSSFTDYFPIDIQLDTMEQFLMKEDLAFLHLWKELSQGTWTLPNKEHIRWKRGQPLGMLPSFAIATMTHGFLLLSLLRRPWKGEFFVLGDDVVILDNKLHSDYMKTLEILGCPFSKEKSISSSSLAEFAGKIIVPTGVIPQMKWRAISDDNFIDICKMIGLRSRCLLRPKQKKVFDQIAHLVEPFGLNFSKPGSTWLSMFKETLDSVFGNRIKHYPQVLMGLRQEMNGILYQPNPLIGHNPDTIEVSMILSTFDEKVRTVLEKTIFNPNSYVGLLDGLSSVPSVLAMQDLPLKVKKPSRVSLLDWYLQTLDL